MYIKFCRSYGEDKKDEAAKNLSSKLSVELEGEQAKETQGNVRLHRAACLVLTVICLVLLLVIIILSMKLQTGSTVCPEGEGITAPTTCSLDQCQAHFPEIELKHLGCQQCANGWLTYGRSCFYLSTVRLNWEDSQKNCSSSGGSLAVISSRHLEHFLTKKGNLNYWIGLKNKGDEWTWVNGASLRESYWAQAPSGGDGDCGILKSESPVEKNWIRASCQGYTYFICQVQF